MAHVVLDPGHGGSARSGRSTPLGCTPSGLPPEKDLTLRLGRELRGRLGGRAALTRDGDVNPSLAARRGAARAGETRAFVSLHAAVLGGREAEVWVHPAASGRDQALARALSSALGGAAVRSDAPMAVLTPRGAARGPAACLVEIDAARLAAPGAAARYGRTLAGAIQGWLDSRAGGRRYGDSWFTDTAELDQYLRDTRGADTEMVSSRADAHAVVDAWENRGSPSAWPQLDAATVAAQIRDRIDDHRTFAQGNLNLCGPAAFLCIWTGRDPFGYAEFAIGLLEYGSGRLGSSQWIDAPDSLRQLSYPRLGRTTGTAPAADFMVMGALRQDANAVLPYDPSSSLEPLAGMTPPGDVAGWLRATGAFSTVRDEANWARLAGWDHANDLLLGAGADAAVLVNINAFVRARRLESLDKQAANAFVPDDRFLLNQFPNHFVVLLSEVVADTSANTVTLSLWTWGQSLLIEVPLRQFVDNYYGAIVTFTQR